VWSNRDRRRIWKSFDKLSEAKAWRAEATTKVRKGELTAPTKLTLDEAAAEFLAGAADGSIRRKDGRPYAPSTIRTYEQNLRLRLLPELGHMRLSEIARQDVIRLVRELTAAGFAPVTIDVALNPLRSILQAHLDEGTLVVNPTVGVKLPRADSGRQRIADPAEAQALLAALPAEDRALWATALYGRPSPGRASGASLVGRGSGAGRDPRRARMGRSRGGAAVYEGPQPASRPDHGDPARLPRRAPDGDRA
jgi:Phage integrase, N-terminal SAM-like domain